MRIKPVFVATCLLLFAGLLAGCTGPAATAPAGAVDTAVAATVQAAVPPVAAAASATAAPAEVSTATVPPAASSTPLPSAAPTLLPTTAPVPVLAPGAFVPYPADQCEVIRASFEQAIGAPVTVESVAFTDHLTGGTGNACRVHATGTGATYGVAGPFGTLQALLSSQSWVEDNRYGAGGPTGMSDGYRRSGALGILTVGWTPSPEVVCPKDQPIASCSLTPGQKLFDVTFDLASVVVYVPLSADQCAAWQAALQPVLATPLVAEIVDFRDLEGNAGTACQVRTAGTGLDFSSLGVPADAMAAVLTGAGWTLVNGADGPTGTTREYVNGNQTAVVHVGWQPSADANCPKDQPIEACPLAPQQKLFSLSAAFGQK